MKKRIALFLSVVMIVSVLGTATVFADGENMTPATDATEPAVTPAPTPAPKPAPVNVVKVKKASKDNSRYTITVSNAQMSGKKATKVQVLTWSKAKGQDDKLWYTAKKGKNNTWSVTVDSGNHFNSGVFLSNVYVNGKYAKQVSYTMSFNSYEGRLITRAQKKSSKTKWLVLVDKKTHRVGIFKGSKGKWRMVRYWLCGDGKKSTPTPSGTFRIGVKGRYFDSGRSRLYDFANFKPHYYFHSVCCNPRTGKPYSGKQLGVGVSHGCVRLSKPNAKWLRYNIPRRTTVYIYK